MPCVATHEPPAPHTFGAGQPEVLVPAWTFSHVPALPGRLQAWHTPVQAVAQQTPLAQKPVWHWASVVQALPLHANGQLPPQSTPVSLPSCTPSWHWVVHWFFIAPALPQTGVLPEQSASLAHATHVPLPSQTLPPVVHGVSAGSGIIVGVPALEQYVPVHPPGVMSGSFLPTST